MRWFLASLLAVALVALNRALGADWDTAVVAGILPVASGLAVAEAEARWRRRSP